MIWFILAPVVALLVGIAHNRTERKDGYYDVGDSIGTGFVTLLAGALISLMLNLIIGIWVPDVTVDTAPKQISGPISVRLPDDDLGYLRIQVNTVDRKTYDDYMRNIVFVDSPDRTLTIRDYRAGNKWLSVFNYNNDDLIIKIPAEESVELTHK